MVRIGRRPVISAERVGTQSLSTLKFCNSRPYFSWSSRYSAANFSGDSPTTSRACGASLSRTAGSESILATAWASHSPTMCRTTWPVAGTENISREFARPRWPGRSHRLTQAFFVANFRGRQSTRTEASQPRQRPRTCSISAPTGERATRRCKCAPWDRPCWSGTRSPQMAWQAQHQDWASRPRCPNGMIEYWSAASTVHAPACEVPRLCAMIGFSHHFVF